MRGVCSAEAGPSYNAGVIDRLRLAFRRTRRIAALIVHIALGVMLAALVFPFLDTRRCDRMISWWAQRLLRVLGVRLNAQPPPALPDGALLVCNHVSWLDIYLILAARRVHFVSKSEVRGWPVVGWLAHQIGTLFIERGRRADTARINAEMHELMTQGRWVAVFPEGTTCDGRGLKRFLPSLLQPAVQLGCPILPAALRYRSLDGEYSAAPVYVDDISLWDSMMRIVSEPGLIAELHFASPIIPSGHRRELAVRAERAVASLLGIAPADTPALSPDAAAADTPPQTPADPPAARP
jgi:1-acyl-sn-glycerol-3-phosphate acyltransferase